MTMTAYITADLFRAVDLFKSTEETRYYLNGVFVEPHPVKGLLLTATDGHRLFNAWDEAGEMTGQPGVVALPKALLKECQSKNTHRATGKKAAIYIENDKPQVFVFGRWSDTMSPRAVVNVGNMVAASRECCIIDGTFPDWRRVVPADVDGEAAPGWFNVGYLADFAKAAKILGDYFGKSQSMMSVHGADAGAPALVRFASDRVFAVLMPMRGNDTTGQRPAYYDARPYPVAEVEISRLDSDTRYPYTADDKAWHFTVSTSLSPITAKESRRFTFPTKAKAARAYNRILAGLQARGMMGGVEPIYPHYDLKPEALKALEDRAERIKEAREAFEAAEPIDLDQPWKRDAVKPEYPSLARHAFMNLPSISEGRAMQSFYKAAA